MLVVQTDEMRTPGIAAVTFTDNNKIHRENELAEPLDDRRTVFRTSEKVIEMRLDGFYFQPESTGIMQFVRHDGISPTLQLHFFARSQSEGLITL